LTIVKEFLLIKKWFLGGHGEVLTISISVCSEYNINMQSLFKMIRPEFFDIFGILVFSFLIISSLWGLKTRKPFSQWTLAILFIIGVLGLIVDGTIVFITYLQ